MDDILLEALLLLATRLDVEIAASKAEEVAAQEALTSATKRTRDLQQKQASVQTRVSEMQGSGSHLGARIRTPTVRRKLFHEESSMQGFSARIWRRDVIEKVSQILRDNPFGEWMQRTEIYAQLRAQGVKFTAENPEHRLTQILSSTPTFENDRTHGWRLTQPAVSTGNGVDHIVIGGSASHLTVPPESDDEL